MSKTTSSRTISIESIPVLSFFTGGALLDIGFTQNSVFKVIWRNENNPQFVKGVEYAMSVMNGNGDYKIHNTVSIAKLDANQIAREAFHNTQIPELFGIIGGPPCPDFSEGGKNRGKDGDHGKLSQVYVNHIIALQPTFFLFENVPGLLKTIKHRNFLEHLKAQLSESYVISLEILNALEYGVPQNRKRIFLVGFHKKWFKKHFDVDIPQYYEDWFPWPEKKHPDALTQFNWPTQSPFGGNPEKPRDIPDQLVVEPLICNQNEIASLPNGEEGFNPKSQKFWQIAEGDETGKSFKRLHRWRFSPTAAYGNNEVHLHPTQARRLTVREALRIQTVPDSYALPPDLTLTNKFKMIGNGVPVKLA